MRDKKKDTDAIPMDAWPNSGGFLLYTGQQNILRALDTIRNLLGVQTTILLGVVIAIAVKEYAG